MIFLTAKLLADMRQAARDDREDNLNRKPATRKMAMMPAVETALHKVLLRLNFGFHHISLS